MKKYIFLLMLCSTIGMAAANQPSVTFSAVENNSNGKTYTAQVNLNHLTQLPHTGKWILAFTTSRPVLSVNHATLLSQKQGGDFYLVEFNLLNGQDSYSFSLTGQWFVKKYTDAPSSYFLIDTNNPTATIPIQAQTELPAWHPAPGEDEHTRNEKKMNTSIEGNPVDTSLTAETTLIVPLPVELKRLIGPPFILNPNTKIIYDPDAKEAAYFFASSLHDATGYTYTTVPAKSFTNNNSIYFTTSGNEQLDLDEQQEGYLLESTNNNVVIRAKTDIGFFYGAQSLRQLLPPQIFSHHLQKNILWTIPNVIIRDYPRFSYRGLHLDVARHFISVDQVKRLIDLMAIHKLNYFQWHLSDDEGWRIEIKRYPQLTQIGAWRSFQPSTNNEMKLMPSFGSGSAPYGGYYTQDDIRAVVQYANDRHITIIPEIDMPGHARAMIASLPDLLIDKKDYSSFTSVQGYHDNVLSPCKNETFEVIDNILTEVADLFPGKNIHIGGDEVPEGAWKKSCMAQKYDVNDKRFTNLAQNDFMQRIQAILAKKNKIMSGWEEIANDSSTLSSPLFVYLWNKSKTDQVYEKALQNSYELIMTPAENLYFDLAYNEDPSEPGQYWAGYVDTFSAYSYAPIDMQKQQSAAIIKGVQGELWSELINSPIQLDYLAFPKIAGLSELAWTPANRRNWRHFSARMSQLHLPRLRAYGVNYRHNEFDF